MKKSGKRAKRRGQRLLVGLCALVMLASLAYVVRYELVRRDILRRNAGFSALYEPPELSDLPSFEPDYAPAETPPVTRAPAASLAALSRKQSSTPARPSPTPAASASEAPAPSPSPSSAPSPTPEPTLPIAVDVTYTPRATADESTLVIALQTPPPVQKSFSQLLKLNPDAAGFLSIPGVLSLPVAQRANDNDFYLSHSFDGAESEGGSLFLDGANLLIPEDDCLIVYGHNMKNGTMFRPLVRYEEIDFLREHPLVRFDTIYENRLYAPFAALTVTADPGSERYMNLRLFDFDEPGFELFVRSLRTLSFWDSPLDVEYGDKLLLLVTCEYTHDNGRFVLALRERRADETPDVLRAQVVGAE